MIDVSTPGHPGQRPELLRDEREQVLAVVEERLEDDVVAARREPEVADLGHPRERLRDRVEVAEL